jgi:hypothetical protein
LDYQGQDLYRLLLTTVKMSHSLDINYQTSWITQGYCSFENNQGMDYHFGTYLIRLLYETGHIYLYVPVSYIQEWLSKEFIRIENQKYLFNFALFVSAGMEYTIPCLKITPKTSIIQEHDMI